MGDDRRILVVEDEYLIRFSLVEVLVDAGFRVLEADDAESALRLAATDGPVDLVLTDLQLPGALDGAALIAQLREGQPGLPVIFTTGRPDRAEHLRSGRDRVIGKPFQFADICAAVTEMIEAVS